MTLPCPVCRTDGPVELSGPSEATVGTVAVFVEHRPVVACAAGHRTTPPEAVEAAMAAAESRLLRARRRLLRGDVCDACGASLDMPVRRTRRTLTVERSDDLPVLTLHFDLPSVRCGSCGADQVPSRSGEDLVVSVPAAFETADRPDGDPPDPPPR